MVPLCPAGAKQLTCHNLLPPRWRARHMLGKAVRVIVKHRISIKATYATQTFEPMSRKSQEILQRRNVLATSPKMPDTARQLRRHIIGSRRVRRPGGTLATSSLSCVSHGDRYGPARKHLGRPRAYHRDVRRSVCLASFSTRKSARTSTRLGRGPPGRRDPVDCSGWQRPIGHQSFQPASSERVAQNEFWENADAGPGKQGWQHRVTVIDAQRTRWPHCRGFAILGEAPSFGRHCIAVTDTAVLGEVSWMFQPAVLVHVCGCADQIGLHLAEPARNERGVGQDGDADRRVEPFADEVDHRIA